MSCSLTKQDLAYEAVHGWRRSCIQSALVDSRPSKPSLYVDSTRLQCTSSLSTNVPLLRWAKIRSQKPCIAMKNAWCRKCTIDLFRGRAQRAELLVPMSSVHANQELPARYFFRSRHICTLTLLLHSFCISPHNLVLPRTTPSRVRHLSRRGRLMGTAS